MKIKRRDGLLDIRVVVARRDLYLKPLRFANYDVFPPKTYNKKDKIHNNKNIVSAPVLDKV